MRVLLIDDDDDLCQLTKKVLTKYGYEVDAFCDAPAGITRARQYKPNLILMDIMLPGLSGPEIVKSLKSDAVLKAVPVVFLTGLVTGEEKGLEGVAAGGLIYPALGKPYEIERLLEIVKKYAR